MIDSVGLSGFEPFKVIFVAILIYALIYALLKKVSPFEQDGINSLIALLSAVIVSFSGVVTFAVSYAINWFTIILFLVFLIMTLLLFLGVKPTDIGAMATKNKSAILIAFFILFSVIIIKSFFALNNTFDTSDPQNNSYEVDTSFNTGVDDVTGQEINEGFFSSLNVDKDTLGAVIFLLVIGVFVILIGR